MYRSFFFPYHFIKQIDFMLPWVCSLIDHRRRQLNVIKTSLTRLPATRLTLRCFYHNLTSSVIYYCTDIQQYGIYLLSGGCEVCPGCDGCVSSEGRTGCCGLVGRGGCEGSGGCIGCVGCVYRGGCAVCAGFCVCVGCGRGVSSEGNYAGYGRCAVLLRIVLIVLIRRVVFGVVGGRVVPVIRVVVVVCVALYESYALLLGFMDFGFCD